MTGTGFDGIVVNHHGMREITSALHTMVKGIEDRMNDLERDLTPLQSDWSGHAQAAYAQAKRKWDTAIAEMVRVLHDTSNTVETSQAEYAAADLRGARAFQIGR